MTDARTPAQWLIAQYEATDPAGIVLPDDEWDDEDLSSEPAAGPWRAGGSVTIQPIFTVKDDLDLGWPMVTGSADYTDPGRWWL